MASTSVQFPDELVARLDELVVRRGLSQSSELAFACEVLLERDAGTWPEGYLSNLGRPAPNLAELRAVGQEMEQAIFAARQDRPVPPR